MSNLKNGIDLMVQDVNDEAFKKKNLKSANNTIARVPYNPSYPRYKNNATKALKKDRGIDDETAKTLVDANTTRTTHTKPNKNQKYMRGYYGKFENGVDYKTSLAQAKKLAEENPDAYGVLHGIRFKDEDFNTSGLRKPIVLKSDKDLNDIRAALSDMGHAKFQFNTYFNKK